MIDVAERVLPRFVPAPVKPAEGKPLRPQPEGLLPKEFPTAGEMTAFHIRLGKEGFALDPDNTRLSDIKEDDLKNLSTSITVAENASTAERVDLWDKKWREAIAADSTLENSTEEIRAQKQLEMWISDIVEKFGQGNPDFIAAVARRNMGNIDLTHFRLETASQIYTKYFLNTANTPDVEVAVINRDGQTDFVTIPSNINRFIEDIFAAYGNNHDEIEHDIDALQWYGGVFGSVTVDEKEGRVPKQVHANEIIREIIETKIKLVDKEKRDKLLRDANFKAEIDHKPTIRANWFNQKEEAGLDYMNVHGRQRVRRQTVPRTSLIPVTPRHPEPAPQPAPEPTPEPQPADWKGKLFYKHLDDRSRTFPDYIPTSPADVAKLIAIQDYIKQGGDPNLSFGQMNQHDREFINQRIQQVLAQIQNEHREIQVFRDHLHLDDQKLTSIFSEAVDGVKNYLAKPPYNIQLPELKNLNIILMEPTTAGLYNPNHEAVIARFLSQNPAILIDWEAIRHIAKQTGKEMGMVSPQEFSDMLKQTGGHEIIHAYAETGFWYAAQTDKTKFGDLSPDELKQAKKMVGRIGLMFAKPIRRDGYITLAPNRELAGIERGRYLMEAVTSKLEEEYTKTFNPEPQLEGYGSERNVLDAIMNKTGVPFSDFVKAYFDRHELLSLAEKLSGKYTDSTGIHHKRKHFLEVVDALMEYETTLASQNHKEPGYTTTIAYVNQFLADHQKQEIANLIRNTPVNIILPPGTKADLAVELGISYEPPKRTATPEKSPWEDLKKYRRFNLPSEGGEGTFIEEWDHVSRIRNIVSKSEVIQEDSPVYYPGSASDITFALAFTDAKNYVFVDHAYTDEKGKLEMNWSPDREIQEIGGKIIGEPKIEGNLGRGGKRIIKFAWGGKERTIYQYVQDATDPNFSPAELEKGSSFVIIKAPSPFGNVGEIWSDQHMNKTYKNLRVGGFIHWQPSEYINPEFFGFRKVIDGYRDKYAQNPEEPVWPLYQKTADDSLLFEKIQIDKSLIKSIYTRDGLAIGIGKDTLGAFETNLGKLREFYAKLPDDQKTILLPTLRSLLFIPGLTAELRQKLTRFGKNYGLTDDRKMYNYLIQANNIAFKVFPELGPRLKDEIPAGTHAG